MDLSSFENPKIYIYYTTLYMKHDRNGKSEVSEQAYEVSRTSSAVFTDLIRNHAEKLVSLDQKSVDDWATGATTPERSDPRLCFRPRPLKKAS